VYFCNILRRCVALRRRVDQAHTLAFSHQAQDHAATQAFAVHNTVAEGVATGSCEGDYRLLLTLQEMRSIVGDDACARVLTALETDEPDAIALRRTTASGRWINFHTDTAARTVQVGSCSSSATAQAPAARCGLVHVVSDA
jgi:hypothetical protein